MANLTRRTFLATAAAATLLPRARATPLNLPLGLQLYSVREQLAQDYQGTLNKLAALGYQEVEAAGFLKRSAPEVAVAMQTAGLHCVSGHYSWDDLNPNLSRIIDFHHQLAAPYIICSFPGFKNPSRLTDTSYPGRVQSFLLEDWRWNADQFNRVGRIIHQAGLRFGYHNHTMEFTPQQDGPKSVVPLDELLRLTDPALVTLEMDCGWVTVGGANPVDYLRRYPERITLLHVKDFKPSPTPTSVIHPPPAAELGQGNVDFRAIFAAARTSGHIRHAFVEQEEYDMDPFAALRIDADYMKNLRI